MAKSKNDNINVSIFTALKVSEISKVPVLIMSNPGLGKSTSVEMFADIRNYNLLLLRGNSTTAEEVLGYDTVSSDPDAKSTKHLRPSWFEEILKVAENGGKSLLFLDEITTANEYTQAALLHLVFERKVGSERLPENTLIVSAGNYAQNLSNSMQMLPPLMNRFMIFNITPDHMDLDTFLCKFDGAIASSEGKTNDFMDNLKKTMKKLDSQEENFSESQYNKIGEYIERGIKQTARALMVSGAKPIDMSVTELNGIYSDTEDDSKLYGFVTLRTLNYLREVTIASFKCFGKSGITSDNYRNMIDGLCGLGISRDPKTKDIVKTPISKEFYDTMVSVVNEIEKMKNNDLPKYTNFFNDIVKGKKTLEVPELQAIINKFKELKNDKNLVNIERPIDQDCLDKLCELCKNSGASIAKFKISTTERFLDKVSAETFTGFVAYWNVISDLMNSLQDFIYDSSKGYGDVTKNSLSNAQKELKGSGFRLKSVRKIILQEDPSVGNLIPEIRSFK